MITPSACVTLAVAGLVLRQRAISSGMEVWENCPDICNYLFHLFQLFLFNKHINNSSACHHILKHLLQNNQAMNCLVLTLTLKLNI